MVLVVRWTSDSGQCKWPPFVRDDGDTDSDSQTPHTRTGQTALNEENARDDESTSPYKHMLRQQAGV
ncbi:MAG: hypothetical protein ACPIOQ_81760 [Promethearchaeia archaeon]